MTGLREALDLAGKSGLVVPGVYDALTARLAAGAGFGAVYLSGASLSYTSFGRPDTGYTGLSDIEAAVRRIASVVSIPVIVDADHGFGGPANVAAAVQRIEAAGASAIQIEDQAFPKKCGHLDGKAVIPAVEMGAKVAAAV
jgi:2-methylisocitrate lyase-like PEP mutase family enzyme